MLENGINARTDPLNCVVYDENAGLLKIIKQNQDFVIDI